MTIAPGGRPVDRLCCTPSLPFQDFARDAAIPSLAQVGERESASRMATSSRYGGAGGGSVGGGFVGGGSVGGGSVGGGSGGGGSGSESGSGSG